MRALWFGHSDHGCLQDIKNINLRDYKYKFVVVRNPWERAVSYYNKTLAEEFSIGGSENLEGFKDFVDLIYHKESYRYAKSLFAFPQTYWTQGVDEVLFFEDWDNNWKPLLKKCEIPYVDRPHENKSMVRFDFLSQQIEAQQLGYERYYFEPEMKDKIYDSFREEIDMYGFRFGKSREKR